MMPSPLFLWRQRTTLQFPLFALFLWIVLNLLVVHGSAEELTDVEAVHPNDDSSAVAGSVLELNSWQDLALLFASHPQVTLVLTLFYSPSCPRSLKALQDLKLASLQIKDDRIRLSSTTDEALLELDSIPSLVFSTRDDRLFPYMGPAASPEDLLAGIWHTYYRLDGASVFDTLEELQHFVRDHPKIMQTNPKVALNPDLSTAEQERIQWFLQTDTPEVFTVFVHSGDSDDDDDWNRLLALWNSHRQVYFATLDDDGRRVDSYHVVRHSNDDIRWTHVETWTQSSELSLQDFCLQQIASKTLYWLDRQATAPIAFHPIHKVHAVLFVNLHDDTDRQTTRQAIQEFQQTLVELHLQHCYTLGLVVPSTETRVLNTFGIDIWTPLEQQDNATTAQVLPVLLITDQRTNVFQRYYLDPPLETGSIATFLFDFWKDRLTPFVKSSPIVPPSTNRYGVTSISARDLQEWNFTTPHVLLVLYAPTCGHCKRFHVIWNELSQFVQDMQWQDRLGLYTLDVTSNDAMVETPPRWLPDVWYFPMGGGRPIRYSEQDEFGHGVGRLSDPMELLAWVLDVGNLNWMDEEGS